MLIGPHAPASEKFTPGRRKDKRKNPKGKGAGESGGGGKPYDGGKGPDDGKRGRRDERVRAKSKIQFADKNLTHDWTQDFIGDMPIGDAADPRTWKVHPNSTPLLQQYIMLSEQYAFDAKLASAIMMLDITPTPWE